MEIERSRDALRKRVSSEYSRGGRASTRNGFRAARTGVCIDAS